MRLAELLTFQIFTELLLVCDLSVLGALFDVYDG